MVCALKLNANIMKRICLIAIISLLLSHSVLAQALMFDQTSGIINSGLVAQDFESFYNGNDCRIADDFTVPMGETWYLDSLRVFGFYNGGNPTTVPGAGVNFQVYEDNNGMPGNLLFSDTIEQNLDIDLDGVISAPFDTPLELTAGDYWVAFAVRKNYLGGGGVAGLWYWYLDSAGSGNAALWENLGGAFQAGCTTWTPINDTSCVGVAEPDVAFQLYGCFGSTKPAMDSLGPDTTFCSGPSITLTANSNDPNIAYLWNTGANTASITTDSAGYYAVTVYDTITLCGVRDDQVINILPTPHYEIADATICQELLPYTINAFLPNGTITWFNNTVGNSVTVNQGGIYWATFEGNNGCIGSDSMTLTVKELDPPIFEPASPVDLCEGQSVGVKPLDSYASYQWFQMVGSNPVSFSVDDSVTIFDPGTYELHVVAANGCDAIGELLVIDRPTPQPEITIGYNKNLDVKLTAPEGYLSYDWSTGDTTRGITVGINGIYFLTVTDQFGCVGSVQTTVSTVGTSEIQNGQAVHVFPNPGEGIYQIEWERMSKPVHIEIYTLDGAVVHSEYSDQGKLTIDLRHLSPGLYTLRVVSYDWNQTLKLIKH